MCAWRTAMRNTDIRNREVSFSPQRTHRWRAVSGGAGRLAGYQHSFFTVIARRCVHGRRASLCMSTLRGLPRSRHVPGERSGCREPRLLLSLMSTIFAILLPLDGASARCSGVARLSRSDLARPGRIGSRVAHRQPESRCRSLTISVASGYVREGSCCRRVRHACQEAQ